MALVAGSRLGPSDILSPLGAGGFGEVYKARATRLDRTVAIKILPSADPELKKRFEREAKAIAALTHPHICTLYDVGQQDGTDYLVMDYLEGETLDKKIARGPIKSETDERDADEGRGHAARLRSGETQTVRSRRQRCCTRDESGHDRGWQNPRHPVLYGRTPRLPNSLRCADGT